MGVGLKVRCLLCGDEPQSEVEGQFVRCSCGAVGVDALKGGEGKTRILGNRKNYVAVPDEGGIRQNPGDLDPVR